MRTSIAPPDIVSIYFFIGFDFISIAVSLFACILILSIFLIVSLHIFNYMKKDRQSPSFLFIRNQDQDHLIKLRLLHLLHLMIP
ncbi:DUF4501 domain-containing protein [Peptacetobacter hominis]|uniref:DUF4501 domain-containing protein n=1 Tax=Peptacetobacter hominis TaxID=2743610 RepID=A0A544QYX1_9FIRM|nr:DUF4501 domain-containing protein [Peptacetobacter hominis]